MVNNKHCIVNELLCFAYKNVNGYTSASDYLPHWLFMCGQGKQLPCAHSLFCTTQSKHAAAELQCLAVVDKHHVH